MKSIIVIACTLVVFGGMISYLILKRNREIRLREARTKINELKRKDMNLICAIVSFCNDKSNFRTGKSLREIFTVLSGQNQPLRLKNFAQVLTRNELAHALIGFPHNHVREIAIFLEPHLIRCQSVEDLAGLVHTLKPFIIKTSMVSTKAQRIWLSLSKNYLSACRRFRELHQPIWARPIIEKFGHDALARYENNEFQTKLIRDSFDFVYSPPTESPPKYCPIHYMAWKNLRSIFAQNIPRATNVQWLIHVLDETRNGKENERVYEMAFKRAVDVLQSSGTRAIRILADTQLPLNIDSQNHASRLLEQWVLRAKSRELVDSLHTLRSLGFEPLTEEILLAEYPR